MTRWVVAAALTLGACKGACEDAAPRDQPGDPKAAPSVEAPAASYGDLPVPADYAPSARARIGPENYREALEALERDFATE